MLLKKISFIFIYLTCLVGGHSCTTKVSNVEVIDIESNLTNYSSQLHLSELSSDIEYVPLETNEKCLLNEIRFVNINEKNILVQAKNGIFLFNRLGRFLRTISGKGYGPGEYILTGVVKMSNDTIFIPTVIPENKILVYNIEGEFLSTINFSNTYFSSSYDNWFYSRANFLLSIPNDSGTELNKVIETDKSGQLVRSYANKALYENLPQDRYRGTAFRSNQFYSFQGKTMYKEMLNDTLWHVNNNTLIPRYVIERGIYGLPDDFRKLSSDEYRLKVKNLILINRLFETNQYLFFRTLLYANYPFDFYASPIIDNLGEHKMPYPVLGCYDKKSRETYIVEPTNPYTQPEPTGIYNDLDGGVNLFPDEMMESILISWFDVSLLKHYISSDTFKNIQPLYPRKKESLRKLSDSLNENDNPVLMLVKLKE